MPEKKIIYVNEDIQSSLQFADSIGLRLLPDMLEEEEPRPRKPEELRSFTRGTIYLFRPEWVVDGIHVRRIDDGACAGEYYVAPGTNFSPITLSFSGAKDVAGVRRLGSGGISFNREWFHYDAHETRPAPPEVEQVYKHVCKHLLSTIHVSGGGHRYYVCKHAAELATRMETLPPFDYLPWPPPDLHKIARKRGK